MNPPRDLKPTKTPIVKTPETITIRQSNSTISIKDDTKRVNVEGKLNDPFEVSPKDPLWNLMQASYLVLNHSKPNLTKECWLCYNIRPPYYEAIGRPNNVRWSNGSNPQECPWNDQQNYTQGITVQSVTGRGKCIGTVPEGYKSLCDKTIPPSRISEYKNKANKWIIPTQGAKWVCSDIGITPCLSLNAFNQSQFCVQVIILPRLMYHTSEEILHHFEKGLSRQKREPFTAITLATLLITGGVGAGTGIASIIKSKEIQTLQTAVDEDLGRIEQSIQNLAASVKSLSEVVLQNRRGLDLLFLKEGGLCVALNEECCSFADHTGVVQDSMAELKKRLDQRKKDRETGKSWYEGWFDVSPWLTTLLSALAGPLILLILGLIFGPCIIKYILHFIRERFDVAKLLILTTNAEYEAALNERNESKNDYCECDIERENYECFCKKGIMHCDCYNRCRNCWKKIKIFEDEIV